MRKQDAIAANLRRIARIAEAGAKLADKLDPGVLHQVDLLDSKINHITAIGSVLDEQIGDIFESLHDQ